MTFTDTHARSRLAVLAFLTLALLTGLLAIRSHPADAATPIIQNSSGQTATFEDEALSPDSCVYTQTWVSVTGSRSVSTTAGGPADVTKQTLLNAYAEEFNWCTYQYREAWWEDVPLAPSQFRIDNALNQAVLSGTIPASGGDGCDAGGNCDGTAGTGTFNITWQRTGDQLIAPSHGTSHGAGPNTVNMEFSGQGYAATANGSIALNGVGGGLVPVSSTNDDYNNQDGAYLSRNMSVSVLVLRPQSITLPAGDTLTFHNTVLSACDPLTWGYQLDDGADVPLGGKGSDCGRDANADTTIGPFAQDTSVRVWLTDDSAQYCGGFPAAFTYYFDGVHALVTGSGTYQVDIMDSGGGCSIPADQLRLPTGPGQGNLSVQLIINEP
jgi:hypothetical protein